MQDLTKPLKARSIVRSWHLVDVKDKVLGRVAGTIAHMLMGKAKPYFVRTMDCGDYVVVINAAHVAVTGRKEKQKMYGNYSGHPGGLKKKPLWQVRSEKPGEVIRHAVWGMLPKNKLRDRMITRLYVHPQATHPYASKMKDQKSSIKS